MSRDEDDFGLDEKMTPKTTQYNVFKKSLPHRLSRRKSGLEKLDNIGGVLGRKIERLKKDKEQLNKAIERDQELIQMKGEGRESLSEQGRETPDKEKKWVLEEIQRRINLEGGFLGSIRDFLKGESMRNLMASNSVSEKTSQNVIGNAKKLSVGHEINLTNLKHSRKSKPTDMTREELESELDHIQSEIQKEVRNQKDNILGPSERKLRRKAQKSFTLDNRKTSFPESRDKEGKMRKLTIEIDLPQNKETPNPKSTGHGRDQRNLKDRFGKLMASLKLMNAKEIRQSVKPFNLKIDQELFDSRGQIESEQGSPNQITQPNTMTHKISRNLIPHIQGDSLGRMKEIEIPGRGSRNKRNIGKLHDPANQIQNDFENDVSKEEKTLWRSKPKDGHLENDIQQFGKVGSFEKKRYFNDLKLELGKSGISDGEENIQIKKKTKKNSSSRFQQSDPQNTFEVTEIKTPKYKNGSGSLKKNIQQPTRINRQIILVPGNHETNRSGHSNREKESTIINQKRSKDEKISNSQSGNSGNQKTSGSEEHFLVKRTSTETSNYSVLRPKHITSQKNMIPENDFPDSSANNHIFPSKQLSGEDDSNFCFSKKQIGDALGISLEQNLRITHETNESALFFSKKRVSEANLFPDITNSEVQNEIKASREMNSIRNGSQAFLNFPQSQAGTLMSNLSAGFGSFKYGSNVGGARSSQRNMLPPEFETDLMSTKEKPMTQISRGADPSSVMQNLMAKHNRREIHMGWMVGDSQKKSSDRNEVPSQKIEGSERGIHKASNRFLFGEDDDAKEASESLWSQTESTRKADIFEIDHSSIVLPESIQAAEDIHSKKKRSIMTVKNYKEKTQLNQGRNHFRGKREILLPNMNIKDSQNSHKESKSGNGSNSNSGCKANKKRKTSIQKVENRKREIQDIKTPEIKKKTARVVDNRKIKNIDDRNYLELKKRNFSKTEPDNKRKKHQNLINKEKMIINLEQQPVESPSLKETTENPSKPHISRENEKKLRKQNEEQKNRIQELGTKYKGLEELLNQTEKKKRELDKKVKIHDAKLQQKERHAKKVELILKKFHTKLKQFPVPKMGFNNRNDLNFLEKQNLKFVKAAHRNQNLLKRQARKLKEAQEKAREVQENAKELENETMDLKDRMDAHRARAERVEREILEVRERNQKYSDLIRNLEDKIMGLEHDLTTKKKQNMKMKRRESKCANCSQRSLTMVSSKKNLNEIEEASHSSMESENHVTIEEYNEMKNDKNDWKGKYNEIFLKFIDVSEKLKKREMRQTYLTEKVKQLDFQIRKHQHETRWIPRRSSRRDPFGSGRG